MAMPFPRLTRLRPPRTLRPLTAVERREYHAVRLALILTAGVMQSGSFDAADQPIPGNFLDRAAWLRRTLAPLRRRSPTVALLRRLIDLEGPPITWDNPVTLGRHLHRLAGEVARLAAPRRRV